MVWLVQLIYCIYVYTAAAVSANAICNNSLLNSVDVNYMNYILTYQDTRLASQCYTFHLRTVNDESLAWLNGKA